MGILKYPHAILVHPTLQTSLQVFLSCILEDLFRKIHPDHVGFLVQLRHKDRRTPAGMLRFSSW